MTTVTLPREVVQQALDALDGLFKANDYGSGGVAVWRLGGSYAPREAIASLRTALDAPATRAEAFADAVKGAKFYHDDEIAAAMNEQVSPTPAQPVSQYGSPELQAMILARAAQPVDCRGCKYFRNGLVGSGCYVSMDEGRQMLCTNGDKFKPSTPIQLYKQEK